MRLGLLLLSLLRLVEGYGLVTLFSPDPEFESDPACFVLRLLLYYMTPEALGRDPNCILNTIIIITQKQSCGSVCSRQFVGTHPHPNRTNAVQRPKRPYPIL